MDEKLKDILSNLQPEVDQKTLLAYLEGKLTPTQQHEVEKNMLEDPFENDALEGLQHLEDKKKITLLVEQLNSDLKKKTAKKKKGKTKKVASVEPWLLFTVVLILLIAVISYLIYHYVKTGI